jgi:nucleoside-diphosphate-sugar epimerase
MNRYLVTGGAGFIGSHIVRGLVVRKKQVRVLDSLSTGKRDNLAEVIKEIDFIEGDTQNLKTCRQAVHGFDCILHQAALPSVQRSISDPLSTHSNNITGTLNMLVAAKEAGIKRFVYASSSSVYGDSPQLPKKEGCEGIALSPYAVSKSAGELYCQLFSLLYGIEAVSLRYFNVFGPRQDPNSQYSAAIPLFISKILKGESPIVYGDGEQSRDFTYVENVVAANILASEARVTPGEVLNIACGEKTSINTIINSINQILGTNVPACHSSERPGEIKHSVADISRAKEALGYAPLIPLKEGLEKTILWYRQKDS